MTSIKRAVVWIVDDTESIRKSLAAVLQAAGFSVRAYASAADFIKDFSPASPGCVIVDHHMPEMNGLELLQYLQQRNMLVPSIVISGNAEASLEQKVKNAGALMLLHKPVDGDELIALIEKIMANKP